MKKIIISFAALGFVITTAFTGSNVCDGNEFFTQGVKSKMGYYNDEGKLTGTGTSEVTKISTSGDSTIAIISSTYEDAKKKDAHTSELRMICVNGMMIMDMAGMMKGAMAQPGKDMQMVIKGNLVPYKTNYTVGEKLENVTMLMEMYSSGALFSTTTVLLTDRKVESYDDLKVPAGTYKSYKISFTSSSTSMMGAMKLPGGKPHKSVMYYNPKVGSVRTEEFKEEKMTSYTELLELTKP